MAAAPSFSTLFSVSFSFFFIVALLAIALLANVVVANSVSEVDRSHIRSDGCRGTVAECMAADGEDDEFELDSEINSRILANNRKHVGDQSIKLQSGSCYLPHPDKLKTGGEDAHFISVDERVIGVADGVGGWTNVGVDAGEYARALMSNSVKAIQDEPKGSIDPARVLRKAHSNTKKLGSSTACIIAITDKGVRAVNLGDSGFIVIRDGTTVFESGVQQHVFNFPYQLENGPNGDLPSSAQVFSFPVISGDVIVAGTDGLFDNLFNSDIVGIVVQGVKAGSDPETTAQNIAALARQRALDRTWQSPFSKGAQEAGFHYLGGKLDDVTVVVAYLSNSTESYSYV